MINTTLLVLGLTLGILLGVIGSCAAYLAVKAYQVVSQEQSRKRQTQSTDAGILDTQADLNNLRLNLEEMIARAETCLYQVERAAGRQRIIRRGPYAYPKKGSIDGQETL